MKTCSMCKQSLSFESFATRNDGKNLRYQSNCRKCQKLYRRKHYIENRQKYIDKAAAWKRQEIDSIRQIKIRSGCKYCDEKHPACLDFHHRNEQDKVFNIGHTAGRNRTKTLKEIEKCDVVCANCHRKLHWTE